MHEAIPGTHAVAARLHNADQWAVDLIVERTEMSRENAMRVLAVLVKERLVKCDVAMSRYTARSGEVWTREVLERALAMAPEARS